MKLNSRGMTLIELMIAVGTFSVIVLAGFTLLGILQTQSTQTTTGLSQIADQLIGESTLRYDFMNAAPSFNTFQQADDQGRSFFDYLPDTSRISLTKTQKERELVLDGKDSNKVFRMIILDRLKTAGTMYVDPAAAYSLSGASAVAGDALSFQGLNYNGYLSKLPNGSQFLDGKTIVQIYSPVYLRPPGTPLSVPPRYMNLFGTLGSAGDLKVETLLGNLKYNHPLDGTAIGSLDTFFRTLPAVGGGSTFVLMRAVNMVEFAVIPSSTDPSIKNLVRRVWNGGSFADENVIAADVTKIILR